MKRKQIYFYCIIIMLFCQVLVVASRGEVKAEGETKISSAQEEVLMTRCDEIKEKLRDVQRSDARTRVYLGRYYETILSKFMTPLNVRLVENSLSSAGFVNNQNNFTKARTNFTVDFVEYQKGLEELTTMDCKAEPGVFYEKLTKVRERRAVVLEDTARIRKLMDEHVKLVQGLKEKI